MKVYEEGTFYVYQKVFINLTLPVISKTRIVYLKFDFEQIQKKIKEGHALVWWQTAILCIQLHVEDF